MVNLNNILCEKKNETFVLHIPFSFLFLRMFAKQLRIIRNMSWVTLSDIEWINLNYKFIIFRFIWIKFCCCDVQSDKKRWFRAIYALDIILTVFFFICSEFQSLFVSFQVVIFHLRIFWCFNIVESIKFIQIMIIEML